MKKQFVKMLLLMMVVMAALSVTAAAQGFEQQTVRLDFGFKVGEQQLPAGTYAIRVFESDHSGRTLLVQNKETNQQAFLSVVPVSRGNDTSMTFSKYGEQHYLSRIGLGDFAYQAIKSRTERNLARQYTAQVVTTNQLVSQAR